MMPDPAIVQIKRGIANTKKIAVGFINFEIEWSGSDVFDLYVDKLVVYDSRGRDIMTNSTIQNEVITAAGNYNSTNIPAWTTVDEPKSIDNYAPLKKVAELLTQASRKLYFCFDPAPWYHGRYGKESEGTFSLNQTEEFWAHVDPYKAGTNISFAINPYFYNSPNTVDNITSYRLNTNNIICNILPKLSGRNFTYIVQGHSALGYLLAPPPSHMLYSTNLGLLYGAKEIGIYNYYTVSNENGDLEPGLMDETMNPTIRYNCVRDEISPLLKGNIGITLKNLDTITTGSARRAFESITSGTSIISPSISSITPPSGECDIDLGFFKDRVNSDYKYFMIINRWYSQPGNYTYNFQNLSGYTNWKLSEYQNAAIADYNVSTSVSYTDNLARGQGKLFRLAPVIKYGGTLVTNETISSSTTLTAPMTVAAGCTLTVNSSYYINALVTVEQGGVIKVNTGGKLFLNTNGNIEYSGSSTISTGWQQTLLVTRKNGHPNLIWQSFTNNTQDPTTYEVLRNYESINSVLCALDGSTLTYMDTELGLYNGDLEAISAYYKIKVTIQGSAYSNTVSIGIHEPDKAGAIRNSQDTLKNIPIEFSSKNFPNPFNPATTISYSIPVQSHVTIEVYNVLSQKIAELENGVKQPGEHKSVFNAANLPSGIYFYNLTVKPTDGSKEFRKVNKMLLIK